MDIYGYSRLFCLRLFWLCEVIVGSLGPLKIISPYVIIGYFMLLVWCLLLVIILMAIGGYLKLNYHILLMVIGGTILLMAIGG
jgi:hypothetical protein